ncbi:hypothetical protein AB0F42_10700 [Streptomyces buecherae]
MADPVAGRTAVLVLAVLRHVQRLADMAGGDNVSGPPSTDGATS